MCWSAKGRNDECAFVGDQVGREQSRRVVTQVEVELTGGEDRVGVHGVAAATDPRRDDPRLHAVLTKVSLQKLRRDR